MNSSSTLAERVTERDYIRHEVEALFAARDRGDKADVLLTSVTLQQVLYGIGIGAGDRGETCARIYMSNGSYLLPNRERERVFDVDASEGQSNLSGINPTGDEPMTMTATTTPEAALSLVADPLACPDWCVSAHDDPCDDESAPTHAGPTFGDWIHVELSEGYNGYGLRAWVDDSCLSSLVLINGQPVLNDERVASADDLSVADLRRMRDDLAVAAEWMEAHQ